MNSGGRRLSRLATKLAHILYGILAALSDWYLTLAMTVAFIIYELDEDWHLNDQAYHDLLDYMVGLSIGALSLLALRVLHIW